ncbi:MAG: PGF-CTERM sorting domain-containing protein [Halobacteriota archaeon]
MQKKVVTFGLVVLLLWACTAIPALGQVTFHPVTNQAELNNLTKMLNNTSESANSTGNATTSTSSGFLGLPGFEAIYGVVGLLVVAYLVLQRRK